ncbi:two-partner secretion domain-containing protein [Mastigocladopsis repens]|uniref:two-partner secretion domain-containing protein n=1 Tax=Mastigocladopsis repens TaxID=221287 RepID=UPI0002D41CF3|nr:filamentous hemagglutinin N-terminal domain-containing protein [Mastigocladopsis repens]
MTTYIRNGKWWQIGIVLAATTGAFFDCNSAVAQIVPDSTLNTEVTRDVDIKGLQSDRIDGGTTRGANLFHSFQEFNVREGRGAYFSNPAGVENIFSRVTGNNSSNISGTLGVLGSANLFLLNPNGIIFGPNAKLDVGGSFLASTANSLDFGDGQKFSATNPNAAPLLTVKVPFGVQFNQAQPSPIVNSANLSVGTGQNLTLLGGTVVSTGQLSAPGGQVAVAAVPGESVVNLNSSGQLLNIETSSSGASGTSSLWELLTSVDEKSYSGLTVKSDGQVELTGSGLSVVDGDVVAKNVSAQTATLTANHNLTLVESQVNTTGDLNLLAGDTVRVRDSVANPFVAQAGDNLTIQGNKGIDILALNHSQTPFVSGGNLSLISDGNISGDAHFSSGGNFSILNLSGSGGNFVSLYDPIIISDGDVTIGNYTGASLKIEAVGNITTGAITINSPDTSAAIDVNDPDYQTLTSGRALILRAGNDTLSGSVQEPDPLDGASSVNYSSSPSSAGNLTINGDIISDFGGPLTVILEANGSIGSISTRDINSTVFFGQGGNISITANGDINTGSLTSFIDSNGQGNAGYIQVTSNTGNITIGGRINSESSNGVAGNVTLTADRDIRTGDITASSNSSSGNSRNFSTITLNSSTGSVFLDGVTLSTTNTGSDYAGDIFINGRDIQIINNSNIESEGAGGRVFIGINRDLTTVSADNVTIRNSSVNVLRNVNSELDPAPIGIKINSNGNIQIETSSLTADTNSQEPPGSISLIAEGSIDIKNGSTISIRVLQDTKETQQKIDFTPTITIKGSSVNITDSTESNSSTQISATTNSSLGSAGDVIVNARSVRVSGNGKSQRFPTGIFAQAQNGGTVAGNITIRTNDLRIENGAQVSVRSPNGQAGDIIIFANNIRLNNGQILATTGQLSDTPTEGANIILRGNNEDGKQLQNDINELASQLNKGELRGENVPGSRLNYLILENDSLIQANANNSANGGNIVIKTRLLLAAPPTGSRGNDISANANSTGNGGLIVINSRPLGIYNIEFRNISSDEAERNKFNDITASSPTGSDGIVSIAQPDVDPKRGIIQLPENLGDSSKLIAQSCPVGVSQAASRFVITGRGGLPPNPSSALSGDAFAGNASSSPNNSFEQTNSTGSTPVEAQGVTIGPRGEIILTANPSKLSSYNSWQRFTGCNE